MAKCRLCLAGILILLAGCKDVTYKFPTEAVVDKDAPTIDSIDKKRWAEMNAFALRATRAVAAEQDGNIAFCPLGLWSASAVLLNAANGKAFESASAVMGLKDPSLDDINSAQRAWHASIGGDDSPLKEGLGVFMIWPVVVTHDFQTEMAKNYRADVLKIGSAGDGARNAINAWADRRTGGAIPHAIDDLTKDTVFTILHVASLRAKWKDPFHPESTAPDAFHLDDGKYSTAQMMHGTMDFWVCSNDDWQGCALPLKDGRFAFVAALPKRGTLTETLKKCKGLPVMGEARTHLKVTLPRFDLKSNHDLLPVLKAMGGSKLLQPPNDLRRMSVELDDEAFINRAFQKVSANVDEEGVKVEEVTGVEAAKSDTPIPTSMVFDRPFLWGIVDTKTGVYLFTGLVRDPSKAN